VLGPKTKETKPKDKKHGNSSGLLQPGDYYAAAWKESIDPEQIMTLF